MNNRFLALYFVLHTLKAIVPLCPCTTCSVFVSAQGKMFPREWRILVGQGLPFAVHQFKYLGQVNGRVNWALHLKSCNHWAFAHEQETQTSKLKRGRGSYAITPICFSAGTCSSAYSDPRVSESHSGLSCHGLAFTCPGIRSRTHKWVFWSS